MEILSKNLTKTSSFSFSVKQTILLQNNDSYRECNVCFLAWDDHNLVSFKIFNLYSNLFKISLYMIKTCVHKTLSQFFSLVKTSLARSYVPETNKSIKKLVIDTDAGADDGMAILSLIAAQDAYPKEFQIVAITCSYGNTFLKDAENNVRKLLTIAKRHDVIHVDMYHCIDL